MFNEFGRLLGKSASRYVAFLCRGYLVVSFFCLQLAGCASPLKLPRYEALGVGAYGNRQVQGDVHVAIQPITDTEEQQKYFGVVLTDAGVLPVLIVVEDHSPSRRFLVRDEFIVLKNRSTGQACAKPMLQNMTNASSSEKGQDVSNVAGLAFIVAGPLIFALPAVLMSAGLGKDSETTAIIQNNMFENTLFTRTVLPNKSISGFAYFKAADGKLDLAGDGRKMLDDLVLHLQAADMDSESRYDFEFRM